MKKIQVGLIGYGFSGAVFHAPILRAIEDFEIKKVVSSNPDKVRNDLGPVEVVPEISQLLDDPEIELVIVVTPNELHYPVAKQALLAGKHVVVEKPFVIESSQAEDLIQIAKERNRFVSVYHNRRWDNDFLTVKQLIETQKLGEIYTYEAHFDRFRPQVRDRWREQNRKGSGILYDLGSHLIDQALLLFGLPKFITADVFAQRPGAKTDDYFHLILGYDKLRVILRAGSFVRNPGPRYQIHGSKGSFIKYGMDSQEEALIKGAMPGDLHWGKDQEECFGFLTIDEENSLKTERVETIPGSYESFYKGILSAIRSNSPLPVTPIEAMNTIKVIEFAIRSSQEKRTIVLDW